MRRWLYASLCILAACADGAPGTTDETGDPSVPWTTADCGFDPEQTGWNEGDVLPDFSLNNQFGSQTSLHQFCDRYVLIQVTNYW